MLVGPRRVAARGVDHAIDGVGTHEVPWVAGEAVIERIANQPAGINGLYAAVEHRVGTAAVHHVLVNFVAFFVFRLRAVDLTLEQVPPARPLPVAPSVARRRDHRLRRSTRLRFRRTAGYHAIRPGKESDGREVVVRV